MLQSKKHGIDRPAVGRQQGLAKLPGGSTTLAHQMGTGGLMTIPISSETCMVCGECRTARLPELFERRRVNAGARAGKIGLYARTPTG